MNAAAFSRGEAPPPRKGGTCQAEELTAAAYTARSELLLFVGFEGSRALVLRLESVSESPGVV